MSYLVASNGVTTIRVYCSAPCSKCTNDPTKCLACLPQTNTTSYIYLSYNYTCVSTCPSGFYLINNKCLSCSINCKTCLNISTNCTSCPLTTYLSPNSTFTCVISCPDYYYANSILLVCSSCELPCSKCSNATNCLTCNVNYTFYNNTCLSNCPIGMIPSGGYCRSCS